MTRIWTGTATVVSGYTTVTIASGDPLTDANCPADATIVLDGLTYFVSERVNSTTIEMTRAYAGVDGTVDAEIDPLTATTTTVGNLAREITDYNARLELLDAYGKGLFYTILGVTGANDPGPGKIARNAAEWASVTALYLDVLDAGGFDATPLIDEWDDGTIIIVRSIATRGYASYRILAAPASQDSDAWRLLASLEYLGGDGALADSEDVAIEWNRVSESGLDVDATVDDVAGLNQYAGQANGFLVLVADSGAGRGAIYTLDTSGSPEEWIGPVYVTGEGLRYDAHVATMAEREAYEGQAAGYAVLVDDVGDGRAGVFTLVEPGSPSNWAGPAYVTGQQGVQGATGDQGPPGNDGANGTNGTNGSNGANGADGTDPGILLTWDVDNTDSDPGTGKIKADNDALGSAAWLYVDKANRAGSDIAAFLFSLDDSTNTAKGIITLTDPVTEAQAGWTVGSVTDATGYVKVAVSGHFGATSIADTTAVSLQFSRTGDKGADGAGAGDVVGPASSVNNRVALFDGTTGKLLKDGGVILGTVATADIDIDTALTANSDVKVASQKATKAYVDQIIAAQDAMVFKGVIDCSANPNYPAADRGWTYRVSVAGKIGGASGANVEAGDILLCLTDSTASGDQTTVGSAWTIVQTNLDGAVIGPASVTDGNPVLFDGTTGKLIKQSTFAAFKTALSIAQSDVSGLGTGDSPQFAGINLGHASDTTFTRVSAGVAAIEGSAIQTEANLPTVSQVDAEAGTATDRRAWTAQRVAQAIAALAAGGSFSVNIQTFTASGTYTPTSGMTHCIAIVTGGGGNGGNNTASANRVAGGGGAGGTAIEQLTSTDIGASQSVTVGAGGSVGASASNGGTSSLGALLSATGGNGVAADSNSGGDGGTGSGGDINISGGDGQSANDSSAGGSGGGSFWGGGPRGAATTGSDGTARAGQAYGTGGGGAATGSGGSAHNGGAGAAGVVMIIEFIA